MVGLPPRIVLDGERMDVLRAAAVLSETHHMIDVSAIALEACLALHTPDGHTVASVVDRVGPTAALLEADSPCSVAVAGFIASVTELLGSSVWMSIIEDYSTSVTSPHAVIGAPTAVIPALMHEGFTRLLCTTRPQLAGAAVRTVDTSTHASIVSSLEQLEFRGLHLQRIEV